MNTIFITIAFIIGYLLFNVGILKGFHDIYHQKIKVKLTKFKILLITFDVILLLLSTYFLLNWVLYFQILVLNIIPFILTVMLILYFISNIKERSFISNIIINNILLIAYIVVFHI